MFRSIAGCCSASIYKGGVNTFVKLLPSSSIFTTHPCPLSSIHPYLIDFKTFVSFGNMAEEKPKVVFVLGGPGAGKGTQCQKIVDRFNYLHLSAGDLLREERARKGSEFGALIDDYIKNGKIVPVEVTCSLLENAMISSKKEKFLIDGFPRNQDNLDGWNRKMTDKVDLKCVLFFKCSEEVCITRCLSRGQSGSGRSDDNMESLQKRIATYNNDSLPIIEYFEQQGKVTTIDASPSAEEVFQEVEKVFENI